MDDQTTLAVVTVAVLAIAAVVGAVFGTFVAGFLNRRRSGRGRK